MSSAGVYPPPPPSYPPPPGSYYPPKQEVYPPPTPVAQGYYQAGPYVAPPPVGYPMRYGPQHHQQPPPAPKKLGRGMTVFAQDVVLTGSAAAATAAPASWTRSFKDHE